ncbi:MAG TPA: hypothetical protein VF173_13810 [Thermoanaerobaculia bacterium]|nr:hypothetical protein [Thermoanaerobaculia bacterium]
MAPEGRVCPASEFGSAQENRLRLQARTVLKGRAEDSISGFYNKIGSATKPHIFNVKYYLALSGSEGSVIRAAGHNNPRPSSLNDSLSLHAVTFGGYFIALLNCLIAPAGFRKHRVGELGLPKGGSSIDCENDDTCNGRPKSPIIKRIAGTISSAYKYIAAHHWAFLSMLGGIVVAALGLGICFFGNCGWPLRVAAGAVGALAPQVLISIPLLHLLSSDRSAKGMV